MANSSSFFKPLLLLTTTLITIVSLSHHNTGLDLRSDPQSISAASEDFGRITFAPPDSVLYPSSPCDISTLILSSYNSHNPFTITARGHGHSIHGQALAPHGAVVEMSALGRENGDERIRVFGGYADVGGEKLWIDVLHETLKHGLTPRSWTDYLYLTVGGTLSHAGVSGQAFRYGPQISNVYELDVVTGKGEMVTCSEEQNPELFFAALGGLGQFGIITRARIALQTAPRRVRWVRMIYTDFATFMNDQAHLISLKNVKKGFDYVEGSLLMDQSLSTNWRSSFFKRNDSERISQLAERFGGAIYYLEASMYYDSTSASFVDQQELELLLEDLNFVPGFVFANDVSYFDFLNRVHDGELKLRSMGLWEVPHPWLNLFVPKSKMIEFDQGVFKGILNHNNSLGPILIYPMNKNKWDERMSAVIPDEEIFYSIGLLRSATVDNWEYLEDQNAEILQFCHQTGIHFKKYLPHYTSVQEWVKHFGSKKWNKFVEMKRKFDPKAILSPGQNIFTISSLGQHLAE